VISATDALALPTAQLTAEETEAANKLEAEIEVHVLAKMERKGIDFESKETRPNVIAEINQRLKAAGFDPQIQFVVDQHPLNKAIQRCIGFRLSMWPSDESYRAAARAKLM